MTHSNESDTSRTLQHGVSLAQGLLTYLEGLNRDIAALQSAFDQAQRQRRKHLSVTAVLLYIALSINVATLIKLVLAAPNSKETPVYVLSVTTVPLIIVILFIVIHGMTSGKAIPISLGMVRTYADDLHAEFMARVGDVLPISGVENAHRAMIEYIKARDAGSDGPPTTRRAEWQRVRFAERQLVTLATEVRTASETVKASSSSDLLVSSYGFALICAVVSVVGFLATSEQGRGAGLLLAIVSILCGLACYLIVRRPTNTQYHIEESLKRLGFSALAVSQRLRAGVVTVPSDLGTDTLLESADPAPGPTSGAASSPHSL